jgi:3-hydroxyacyl-[acyl-carrier-protein] dehydratase
MTRQEILDAIPHRDPFLLVDAVTERTDSRIVGEKTFSGNEWFFAGHYPDFPLVPGVLLCEAAMQCGAILLSHLLRDQDSGFRVQGSGDSGQEIDSEVSNPQSPIPNPSKIPVATRMGDVRFKRMVRPGEKIVMEVELKERLADAFFLAAKVSVDGKVAVRFEFACTAAERAE